MLILTRADIQQLIRIEPIIEAVAAAHAALARGDARQSTEAPTVLPRTDTVMLPMAAALIGTAGVKLLTDAPGNAARGLHPQHSTITIVDPDTGHTRALLDGVEITRYRTAAASAVATRYLADAGARTLGLIGAGAQASSHLWAMRAVRDFDRVVVWSRSRATAERFVLEHSAGDVTIEVVDTPEAVVRVADVVCTLTPSRQPFVHGSWFRPGLHVNAVGAPPRPDHREVDTEGIQRSLLVVDDRAAATTRSGEVCIPLADGDIDAGHIHAELGQLVTGERAGRTGSHQITLFNSVGLAIQDLAAANHLIGVAEAEGIGTTVELSAVHEPRDGGHDPVATRSYTNFA